MTQKEDNNRLSILRLIDKTRDGTINEILDDWRWIFSYSRRYKGAIVFYTIIGVMSTSFALVTSVASKYLIDIITGYQTEKLGIMVVIVLSSSLFTLLFTNIVKRFSAKLFILSLDAYTVILLEPEPSSTAFILESTA